MDPAEQRWIRPRSDRPCPFTCSTDPDEIRSNVRRLVLDSGNPWLSGVCCINVDQNVADEQIAAIFEEVELLREEYAGA